MTRTDKLGIALWLALLAYLGFYVFGLVMGVYTPLELPWLGIPVVVLAVAAIVQTVRARNAQAGRDPAVDRAIRESRSRREERGF